MSFAKEHLIKMINDMQESDLEKIRDFAESMKEKEANKQDMASESCFDFWENDIDDEVWNNV